MKITEIKLGLVRVPLITPFKTALRTVNCVEDIIVAIHTDSGHIGYGEAPATAVITGDTHGSIRSAIEQFIAPKLIGEKIADLNALCQRTQSAIVNNYSAKAAVEIALYDLFAQSFEAPLYRVLGGDTPLLKTDITISVDTLEKMVGDAQAAVARGFTALKIKVGKDFQVDIERVKAIHSAVNGRASLRLDANQGWSAKQAVYVLRALEQAGIKLELIEQPVKAHDIAGLKYIRDHVLTPVMADESVFSPRDVIDLLSQGAVDIINIKLMKCGGLSNALRIADIAALYDIECMMGCMLESSISVSAAAHLASAKSNIISKLDLDGPSLCQFNPAVGGAQFHHADISLDAAPGLGIRSINDVQWF